MIKGARFMAALLLLALSIAEGKKLTKSEMVMEHYRRICTRFMAENEAGEMEDMISCPDGWKDMLPFNKPGFDYDAWLADGVNYVNGKHVKEIEALKAEEEARLAREEEIRKEELRLKQERATKEAEKDEKFMTFYDILKKAVREKVCKKRSCKVTEVKPDDYWTDLKKLTNALQSAVDRESKIEVRALATELLRQVSEENHYYASYEAKRGKIHVGRAVSIVDESSASIGIPTLTRNDESQITLDRKIEGVGCVYSGHDVTLPRVQSQKTWDPRYSSKVGGEIMTKSGNLTLTRAIGGKHVKGGILNFQEKSGMFNHLPCDAFDPQQVSEAREVKLILVDPFDDIGRKKLVVRATIRGKEGKWSLRGNPTRCKHCLTKEMAMFLEEKGLLIT